MVRMTLCEHRCTYVHIVYAYIHIQLNLSNTKLYGPLHNFMLTVFCVNSTYIMCVYISSECSELTKFHDERYVSCAKQFRVDEFQLYVVLTIILCTTSMYLQLS